MESEIYRKTREAWRRIWREETDLTRELQTLEYDRTRRIRSLYIPYLPKDELILEAGCGLGIELVYLCGEGYRAVGLDYADNALAQLQAWQPGHLLTAGDVHHLPYRSGSFSTYLSFGVLEHFEFGPGPALLEAHRVLRPGGILVLTVPYPNLVWRLARSRRLRAAHVPADQPRYFETTYTVRELEGYVRRAGFVVVDRRPIGHSFTLWGLGSVFRGPGYYETSPLAESMGGLLLRLLPWSMCFQSFLVGRKDVSV
jgi:SAM-dependent methyltransferase